MSLPYGFDCYAFSPSEVKYFEPNVSSARSIGVVAHNPSNPIAETHKGHWDSARGETIAGYVRFTRKNEHYTLDQLQDLASSGRFDMNDVGKHAFCGIKIQIGIGVVTNFLRKGLQYRQPISGRSELTNGTWSGIVSGLTKDQTIYNSYDMAFGNFLAYDEEFPYIKFGPFFAIESKLVLLTGGSRSVEASSFGTTVDSHLWVILAAYMLVLSLLSAARLFGRSFFTPTARKTKSNTSGPGDATVKTIIEFLAMVSNFLFIYFTMLLNKPSIEFEDFVFPNHANRDKTRRLNFRGRLRLMPTSIRILSYLWSIACFVMVSVFSGEMLAVILLHAEENIDTINQLINSDPPMEPVIRQDDFTYNLMLKSPDRNMLTLYNMTTVIPRPEVYTKRFIESISMRKQALLGDDELIETIYDIYHKQYSLYKSKISYLQYPISIMYRKNLNATLEKPLRRGMVQIFEMGLVHRWYQAQKETFVRFYNKDKVSGDEIITTNVQTDQKYKPLPIQHFFSIFKLLIFFASFAFAVLGLEIATYRYEFRRLLIDSKR